VLIDGDAGGVFGSDFGSGFAGEQRSGVRHVDGLALPTRNA
jgi:hypothetical protein